MTYSLTLTHHERQAIDWVGNRYWNGTQLWRWLWLDSLQCDNEIEWIDESEITFYVREEVAWLIKAAAEEEGWPCFGPGLVMKLNEFLSQII